MKQWKEGYFAAGMTAATWGEEYQKWRHNFRDQILMLDDNEKSPCGCCSAVVCGLLGAGRVGNMAVLKQSTEWVEEEEEDENGELRTKRVTRPRLDVVVGPVSGRDIYFSCDAMEAWNFKIIFAALTRAFLCPVTTSTC